MASQVGFTLSTSRTGSAQGLQTVLLTELESSKIVAKVLAARFPLYPLQNSGPETKPKVTQVERLVSDPGQLIPTQKRSRTRTLSSQPARELKSWTVTGYRDPGSSSTQLLERGWLSGPACTVQRANQTGVREAELLASFLTTAEKYLSSIHSISSFVLFFKNFA